MPNFGARVGGTIWFNRSAMTGASPPPAGAGVEAVPRAKQAKGNFVAPLPLAVNYGALEGSGGFVLRLAQLSVLGSLIEVLSPLDLRPAQRIHRALRVAPRSAHQDARPDCRRAPRARTCDSSAPCARGGAAEASRQQRAPGSRGSAQEADRAAAVLVFGLVRACRPLRAEKSPAEGRGDRPRRCAFGRRRPSSNRARCG